MLPLYLPETMHINIQAHSNVYAQGHVEFTDKWGQPQSHLVVSTMRCMIRTLPPVVKLTIAEPVITAKPGDVVQCRLDLVRTSNFTGPMQVEVVHTPDHLRLHGRPHHHSRQRHHAPPSPSISR